MMNGNNTVTRQFGALMDAYDMLLTPHAGDPGAGGERPLLAAAR